MSIWDKKFKMLLEASEENTALKEHVITLESQILRIAQAVSGVQKSCIDLTKILISNKREIDDICSYLTAESNIEDDQMQSQEAEGETLDELAQRKRMMN